MARTADADGVLTLDADEVSEDRETDGVPTGDVADPADFGPTWLGGAGVLVVTAALVVFGDLPGLLAAVIVAGGWFLLANTYAFALGQVALVSVFSGGPVAFAAAQAGVLAVLFAPLATGVGPGPADDDRKLDADASPELVVLTAAGLLGGGAAAWAGQQSLVGLPVAGLLLVGGLALAAYGLHRYQLVALGLVDDSERVSDSESGNDSAPSDPELGGDGDEQ